MAEFTSNKNLYKWNITDTKRTTINEMKNNVQKIEDALVGLDTGLETVTTNLAQITNYVYVKSYGAVGDGITDDTQAIVDAIAYMETNNLKGYIVFGKGTFKHTGFTISKADIGIKGENATLYGGTANVRGAERTANTAIPDFNFRCEGIEFLADDNSINLLSIRNARIIDIKDCVFRNGDKSIVFEQSNYTQHCNRIKISGTRFYKANHFIYINPVVQDQYMLDTSWSVGDIQIVNCQFFLPNITHIYARQLDGIVLTNSTFFFIPLSNATTAHHLDIYKLNWGIISNNNFFESGLESIKIGQFKGLNIGNNVFVNTGLREPASAIKLFDGDSSGLKNCSSIISQNVIFDATKHGIEIGTNCENVITSLNNIRDIGVGRNYFGTTALNTITHYSIEQPNTVDSLLLGNMSSGYDMYSLVRPSSLAISNITKSRDKKESKPQATIDNSLIVTGVVDVKDNDLFYVSLTSATSIDNFTGYAGQEITLFRIGSFDVTINHNTTKIRTKTKANKVLTSGDTMKLVNIGNVWWEV